MAIAVGLIAMLLLLPDSQANRTWAAGLIPFCLGVALVVSSFIVRQGTGDDRTGGPKA